MRERNIGRNFGMFIAVQLRDIIITLFFSSFITFFFAGRYLFTNFETTYKNILFGFFIAYSLWKGNQLIGWISDKLFPWEEKPKHALIVSLSSSIIYTLIIIVLVHIVYYRLVFNIDISENINRWITQIVITFLISLLITVIYYLLYFFKWWRLSVVNEEKLKQEAVQLRYDALKSQVNPHFLFNSFSVLSSLVDTDTAKAKDFIQQFSNIYRYVLEQREQEVVSLEDELNFIKSYINLHQIRHGNNLNVSVEIADNSGYIIPLSIQILLENCFKHNIISEEMPLNVKVWREGDYITVQNNLQKRKTIHDSGGIGLETIFKRYEFLSEKTIQIENDDVHFLVRVPIIKLSR